MRLVPVTLIDQADEVLPPVLQRLEARAIEALGEDWYKSWQVGLPRPEDTPDCINIPVILRLGNLLDAYDMQAYASARYNLLGGAASHWFPGSRANNVAQLDLQACLAHSPHADKIPARLAEIDRRIGGAQVKRLSQS